MSYLPQHASRSQYLEIRGLRYHLRQWTTGPGPLLVMLHGWMDVSASFQFVVDHLALGWRVVAPDWRGFGETAESGADSYWFADYLADLDAIGNQLSPEQPFAVVGHSMGGNVAMLYAGIRPHRVAAVVNLEGFGLNRTEPGQAVERYRGWLDDLNRPASFRGYRDLDAVADHLTRVNPRLERGKAVFLAPFWARRNGDGYEPAADPRHRRSHPVLYRLDEVLACWREITAPVLWVTSDADTERHRSTRTADFRQRLTAIARLEERTVAAAGHMLHHDRPAAVAEAIEAFVPR